MLLQTCTELCITYRIAENFRGRKLSQIGEKYDFRGENLCGLLASAAPKDTTSPKFHGENFCESPQNRQILSSSKVSDIRYC